MQEVNISKSEKIAQVMRANSEGLFDFLSASQMGVEVHLARGFLFVKAPYFPRFAIAARRCGGRWMGETWRFPHGLEGKLAQLLIENFGCYGNVALETPCATVYYPLSAAHSRVREVFDLGRRLVRRSAHNGPVVLHESVELHSGGFHRIGGSRDRAVLNVDRSHGADCLLKVHDTPVSLAIKGLEDGRIVAVDIPEFPAGISTAVEHLLQRRTEIKLELESVKSQLIQLGYIEE